MLYSSKVLKKVNYITYSHVELQDSLWTEYFATMKPNIGESES